MVKSKDQPEQGVGEGHPEAEDEEVLVLDRDKGQWELDLENHPLQCINNLGTGDGTKTDEFSEKFQTPFDPPSFSEYRIAIFF